MTAFALTAVYSVGKVPEVSDSLYEGSTRMIVLTKNLYDAWPSSEKQLTMAQLPAGPGFAGLLPLISKDEVIGILSLRKAVPRV
jgi:hypothetical protein